MGYIILIISRNAALSYAAVYLAACGIYPNIPNTNAWVSNNTEGGYKRSVTLAMIVGFANLNGGVTSNVVSSYFSSITGTHRYSTTSSSIAQKTHHGTRSDTESY